MQISIFTATGHQNLGDELILLQEYMILKEYYPEAIFKIFTYNKESSMIPEDDNIEYISYFPNGIRKNPLKNFSFLLKNFNSIRKSDLIIIGGGGLIYEKEIQNSSSPLWQWKMRVLFARLFHKKIVWLAVGISFGEKNIHKIRFLFSGKNTFASVRDKKSQNLLNSIGIDSTLLDDPVFSYFPKSLDNKGSMKVGISIRQGYLKDELENLKQMILFLSRKGYYVVFISHSIHAEDRLANDHLFIKDLALTYNIQTTKTMEETLNIYPKLKFVIGMRFHSLILSIVHNIPFIALSYGNKTDELLKEFDYRFQMDPSNFEFEGFIRKFQEIESKENDAKFALKSKYDTMIKNFNLKYNNFLNGLESIKR